MQSQMTLGKKLFLCFGGALALTLMISAVALLGFSSLGGQVKKLVGVNTRKLFLAGDVNNAAAEIISVERGII